MSETAMVTLGGKLVDFLDPDPEAIDIREIAHALSGENRFTNHTDRGYTVASHSLMVCSLVRKEFQLQALLHDAHEAYTGDINRPLAHCLGRRLHEIKVCLDAAIFFRFGVRRTKHSDAAVHRADNIALSVEFRDLKRNGAYWGRYSGLPPAPEELRIELLRPEAAYLAFLEKFEELTQKRLPVKKEA